MENVTRGWPASRRKKQAENARRVKPWEKSTGPVTEAGRKACARNAYKHGLRGRHWAEIRRLLRRQRAVLRALTIEAAGRKI